MAQHHVQAFEIAPHVHRRLLKSFILFSPDNQFRKLDMNQINILEQNIGYAYQDPQINHRSMSYFKILLKGQKQFIKTQNNIRVWGNKQNIKILLLNNYRKNLNVQRVLSSLQLYFAAILFALAKQDDLQSKINENYSRNFIIIGLTFPVAFFILYQIYHLLFSVKLGIRGISRQMNQTFEQLFSYSKRQRNSKYFCLGYFNVILLHLAYGNFLWTRKLLKLNSQKLLQVLHLLPRQEPIYSFVQTSCEAFVILDAWGRNIIPEIKILLMQHIAKLQQILDIIIFKMLVFQSSIFVMYINIEHYSNTLLTIFYILAIAMPLLIFILSHGLLFFFKGKIGSQIYSLRLFIKLTSEN